MTVTWNNGATVFNAIKMNVTNTASDSTSKLIDLRVGGTIVFNIRAADGYTVLQGQGAAATTFDLSSVAGGSNAGLSLRGGTGVVLVSGSSLSFSNHTAQIYAGSQDTALERQSPAVLKATNAAGGAGLIRLPALTVATLPAAATAGVGARSTVTDALAPTFMATVTAGGAVITPVYSDGTNWKVG